MTHLKTAVTQVRTDIRTLAAIAVHLDRQNSLPTTRSGFASRIIEDHHDALVLAGLAAPIDSTEEAANTLEALGLGAIVRDSSHLKAYLSQVSKEDLKGDMSVDKQTLAAAKQAAKKVKGVR